MPEGEGRGTNGGGKQRREREGQVAWRTIHHVYLEDPFQLVYCLPKKFEAPATSQIFFFTVANLKP